MRSVTRLGMIAAVGLALGPVSQVRADAIPYPNAGKPNPVTYTFTAAADGPITAYFAGSTAGYNCNGALQFGSSSLWVKVGGACF